MLRTVWEKWNLYSRLNVPKTLNVLWEFNLDCVSTVKGLPFDFILKDEQDINEFHFTPCGIALPL